ncbi:CDPK-related kinase 6-like [Magnolia sinica]|uniref:CDPK-related kinase 6-like n=1 Tax=Magnolia sinica TaxID=86752 RepID=UPI00265A2DC0|nr:CDPK-related kinase 6-like [Magnolia sinica]
MDLQAATKGRASFLMDQISYRKMDFEDFCAAVISSCELEALKGWEQIASMAFEHFEQERNPVILVEELAWEMNLGPMAHSILHDWIKECGRKPNFLGYTKFLHGVTRRSSNTTSVAFVADLVNYFQKKIRECCL